MHASQKVNEFIVTNSLQAACQLGEKAEKQGKLY